MKYFFKIIILLLCLGSCKSSKKTAKHGTSTKKNISKKTASISKKGSTTNYANKPTSSYKLSKKKYKSEKIIDYAKQFYGVRYKWGGTTKSGVDCSGLIYESFKAYNVILPRISRDMAKRGRKVTLKQVKVGDLLFFKTSRNRRNTINHVGLIISIKNNNIQFIHATTSKGVISSWLNEKYWLNAFTEARSIL